MEPLVPIERLPLLAGHDQELPAHAAGAPGIGQEARVVAEVEEQARDLGRLAFDAVEPGQLRRREPPAQGAVDEQSTGLPGGAQRGSPLPSPSAPNMPSSSPVFSSPGSSRR